MTSTQASPIRCSYPKGRHFITFLFLLLSIGSGYGVIRGLQDGEQVGAAFFILLAGSAFFFLIFLLSLSEATSVIADETGVQSIALFGRTIRHVHWNEVESVSFYKFPGERGSNKPPTGYAFNRYGDKKGFSFRKRRIGFSEDMAGYEEMEKIALQKSAEYGFPVQQD